jgi:hypothetical protein
VHEQDVRERLRLGIWDRLGVVPFLQFSSEVEDSLISSGVEVFAAGGVSGSESDGPFESQPSSGWSTMRRKMSLQCIQNISQQTNQPRRPMKHRRLHSLGTSHRCPRRGRITSDMRTGGRRPLSLIDGRVHRGEDDVRGLRFEDSRPPACRSIKTSCPANLARRRSSDPGAHSHRTENFISKPRGDRWGTDVDRQAHLCL